MRKILHIDMDAFYASVEIKDNQNLENFPIIVGGKPNSRGVVCTANYIARKFGIHSGMACSIAYKLCPKAIFIPPRFERYYKVSKKIHEIFHRYTNLVESFSLDEAWLDVTENHLNSPSATWIAEYIKKDIKKELGLTCSAGISYNKFLAKIASGFQKPDGLFVVTPKEAENFLMSLPIRKFFGVGKATERKLNNLGIFKGFDLYQKDLAFLENTLGKFGKQLYFLARGIDDRPVVTFHKRKSLSVENTFEKDVYYGKELKEKINLLLKEFFRRTGDPLPKATTFNIKVKFFDFYQITRSKTIGKEFLSSEKIIELSYKMLENICLNEYPLKKIRLLGIGISNLE